MGKQRTISHSELEKNGFGQGVIISVISVYGLQFGFDDNYVSVIIKFGEKEVAFIAGDFSGIVEDNEEDYEDQHEGHGHKC